MSTPRKRDSQEICDFIVKIKERPWLGPAQKWWPDYLYRVDALESAVKILESEKLLSRAKAIDTGVMGNDCACAAVISKTDRRWLDYVRLYFRPLTPTQFRTEGFLTREKYFDGAHCPVPIVLLFDSHDILTRANTCFSNGNLARSDVKTGSDVEFLRSIPFVHVYHNHDFESCLRDSIVFHRNAEVIVPGEIDLDALRYIGCRTQAEYQTLYHLLSPQARRKWGSLIGTEKEKLLHYKRWTFVERAELSRDKIVIQFNPSSETPGPFSALFEMTVTGTKQVYSWKKSDFTTTDGDLSPLAFDLHAMGRPTGYTIRLLLDNRVAYAGQFTYPSRPL